MVELVFKGRLRFMNIIRYYKYQGHIDEISKRYPSFRKVHDFWIKKSFETTWRDKFTGDITYHVLTTFVGKTGYGKSSTINRFFGREIMEISDVKACTRECQSIDFRIRDNTYFSFGDMPGIGEDKARDRHYLKMYEDFLTFSSTIVYILRADMRDYSIDLAAYKRLFRASDLCRRVIFALNYCDKIEPISRVRTDTPTEEQKKIFAIKFLN